jgi:hypothetical protein
MGKRVTRAEIAEQVVEDVSSGTRSLMRAALASHLAEGQTRLRLFRIERGSEGACAAEVDSAIRLARHALVQLQAAQKRLTKLRARS